MDNLTDALLVDQAGGRARELAQGCSTARCPRRRARMSPESGVPDALIAEPASRRWCGSRAAGASARCCSTPASRRTGWSRTCAGWASLPGDIEVIVLSHGHWDHVTGMEGLVRTLGRTSLPVMIHPEFWSRRRIPSRASSRPSCPRPAARRSRSMGFAIVEERQPSFLLDGAVLITGEVDRTTPFETGFQGHEALRDGELAARPADPRRPGARGPRARPRPGGPDRLRPRRHRQHRALRAAADRRATTSRRSSAAFTSAARCSSRSSSRPSRRSPSWRRRCWCRRTARGGRPSTGSPPGSPTRS